MQPQPIILISGFSGAGKTTFWQEIVNHYPGQIIKVTSSVTRPPRENEVPGVDYHFLTTEDFLNKKEAGHFMETSEHFGNHYGSTSPEKLDLEPGQVPLYTVDPNGVASIKAMYPHAHAFFMYISPEEQYRRLTSRGESPEVIQKRLDRYQEEADMLAANQHHYHILRNEEPEDLQKAIEQFRQTVQLG